MFAFDRSPLAVLIPLALLLTVAVLSSRNDAPPEETTQVSSEPDRADQVAANLPSR